MSMQIVQMLLIVVIFLSVMVEIKTGGVGLGAVLGLIAAGIFWGSSYFMGAVSILQVGLFILGLLFIIVEILTPTIGLIGAIGAGVMLYSLVLAMGGDAYAMYFLLGALVISIIIFALILKKLPSSRLWNKVILTKAATKDAGYSAGLDYDKYLGAQGVVVSELRPAGCVEINHQRVDVVSNGEYISKGTKVKVIHVEGVRIVVQAIDF